MSALRSRFTGPWTIPLALLLPLALAAACGEPDTGETADEAGEHAPAVEMEADGDAASDSARILAHRLLEWQGGRQAWDETRFLAFRWIVERGGETLAARDHAWDRYTGRYRLSFGGASEDSVVALFDVNSMRSDTVSPSGDVWVGGERLEGTARDSALRDAYGAFINDSYWLLMPLKWHDPGVHLSYEGWRELPDGERYPTVSLTFEEDLGITNDRYWGFLDPETGRLAAWQFHLEGQEERGPVIWWRDWRQVGPIRLATDRRWAQGDARIHFEDLRASRSVPEDAFTAPDGGA